MTETKQRIMDPNAALDFPHLDPGLWVLWSSNSYAWPHAKRQVSYITNRRFSYCGVSATGKLKAGTQGFALFTPNHDEAATFKTEVEALAFLTENEARRPRPYGVKATTVQALIDLKYNSGKPLL